MASLWKRLTYAADALGSVFEKEGGVVRSNNTSRWGDRDSETMVAERRVLGQHSSQDKSTSNNKPMEAHQVQSRREYSRSFDESDSSSLVYQVQAGDSLVTVAMSHHMSTAELRRLNHMYGAARLFPGQTIKVKKPRDGKPVAEDADGNPIDAGCSRVNKSKSVSSDTVSPPSTRRNSVSTGLANSQQKPTRVNVYFCTKSDERIAGTLTMSYQLLLFEPSLDDPLVKEDGILKYQFCMDVRGLIGGCEISHTTNVLTGKDSIETHTSSVLTGLEVASSTQNGGLGQETPIPVEDQVELGEENPLNFGEMPRLHKNLSSTVPVDPGYDQTQWSMLQVFWREENSVSFGEQDNQRSESSPPENGKYYMLFLVPKLSVEDFLDTMNRFVEQQQQSMVKNSKKSSMASSPYLTAGAVGLLRRSISESPEPSSMYTQFSYSGMNKLGAAVAKRISRGKEILDRRSSSGDKSAKNSKSLPRPPAILQMHSSVHVPKIIGGISRMLSNDDRINVASALPYDAQAYNWQLEYSSNIHGLSWYTLHRCIAKTGPNIVLIRTTEGEVLGGYASQTWKPNGEYIGTGECSVFHCKPGSFSIYTWTGRNSYFMMATDNMMAMGGGGDFAFQIDAQFKGTTGKSETFGNRPLLASSDRDFHVFDIEVSCSFESYKS